MGAYDLPYTPREITERWLKMGVYVQRFNAMKIAMLAGGADGYNDLEVRNQCYAVIKQLEKMRVIERDFRSRSWWVWK